MADEVDYARLRRDIGATILSLTDEAAELLFVEAAETYTDAASAAAYTRILGLQGLLSASASMTSYKQNESSEEMSDMFKALEKLLAYWQRKLDDAVTVAADAPTSAARFGRTTQKPARIKEYPGYGWGWRW